MLCFTVLDLDASVDVLLDFLSVRFEVKGSEQFSDSKLELKRCVA